MICDQHMGSDCGVMNDPLEARVLDGLTRLDKQTEPLLRVELYLVPIIGNVDTPLARFTRHLLKVFPTDRFRICLKLDAHRHSFSIA